jgi:mRNA interferase HigB
VRILSKKNLRHFWMRPGMQESEHALRAWYRATAKADWSSPADVKAQLRNASVVGNNRVVFNVAGNKYRLVVKINYPYRVVYIRFVGTHAEYDKIDVETI